MRLTTFRHLESLSLLPREYCTFGSRVERELTVTAGLVALTRVPRDLHAQERAHHQFCRFDLITFYRLFDRARVRSIVKRRVCLLRLQESHKDHATWFVSRQPNSHFAAIKLIAVVNDIPTKPKGGYSELGGKKETASLAIQSCDIPTEFLLENDGYW